MLASSKLIRRAAGVLVGCAFGITGSAAVAAGAGTDGHYAGSTSQHAFITFDLDQDVINIDWFGFDSHCKRSPSGWWENQALGYFTVGSGGSFARQVNHTTTNNEVDGLPGGIARGRVHGALRGHFTSATTVRGSFQATITVTDKHGNKIDTCHTGHVTWKAKLKHPAADAPDS